MAGFIHWQPQYKYNNLVLVVGVVFVILLVTSFSGGVNSRFTVLIPVMPVLISLVFKNHFPIVLTSILLVSILLLFAFHQHLPNYSISPITEFEVFAKALWLAIATLFALVFSLVYRDINSKLTISLESPTVGPQEINAKENSYIVDFADKSLLKLNLAGTQSTELALMLLGFDDEVLLSNTNVLNNIIGASQKALTKETDKIGYYKNNVMMACIAVPKNANVNQMARRLSDSIVKNKMPMATNVNIGFITVSANIGVDLNSLLSVASIALQKAQEKGENAVVNYNQLKK